MPLKKKMKRSISRIKSCKCHNLDLVLILSLHIRFDNTVNKGQDLLAELFLFFPWLKIIFVGDKQFFAWDDTTDGDGSLTKGLGLRTEAKISSRISECN
jgi:hypothetical protein